MDPLTLFDEHESAGIPGRSVGSFVDHTGTGIEPPTPETIAELEAMRAGMSTSERCGGRTDSMMDEKHTPSYGRKIRRKKGGKAVGEKAGHIQ